MTTILEQIRKETERYNNCKPSYYNLILDGLKTELHYNGLDSVYLNVRAVKNKSSYEKERYVLTLSYRHNLISVEIIEYSKSKPVVVSSTYYSHGIATPFTIPKVEGDEYYSELLLIMTALCDYNVAKTKFLDNISSNGKWEENKIV